MMVRYKRGEIVWVKINRCPWWPAEVLDRKLCPRQGSFIAFVKFFNEDEYQVVTCKSNILPFMCPQHDTLVSKGEKYRCFSLACKFKPAVVQAEKKYNDVGDRTHFRCSSSVSNFDANADEESSCIDTELPDILPLPEANICGIPAEKDAVWVKYRKYPYWPAVIQHVRKENRLVIHFLGQDADPKKKFFLRFNKKNVLPFSDLKRKEFEERGKQLKEPLRTQFKKAIDDAIVYINKRALGSMGVEDVWNTDAAFNMSPEVQSEPQQSLEAPPVKRRRLTIARPLKRRRLTIAPPVKRRRLTIAPPVKRRRLTIADYNSRASKQIDVSNFDANADEESSCSDTELPDILPLPEANICGIPAEKDAVWVKYRKYPYWPAVIQHVRKENRLVIHFLGQDADPKKKFFLRFNKKNVLPFSDLKRKEFEERGKQLKEPLRTQFKNAIDDAIVYINKRALGSMGVEDVWNTDAAFNMSPEVQSEPQQSLEAPPVKRRRLTIAPPVKRRRLTIAPPVKRRRLTIAPPVKRRRLTIADYNSRASKQIDVSNFDANADEESSCSDTELPDILPLPEANICGIPAEKDAVWVKYRKYPYWPAVIQHVRKKKRLVIHFLGQDADPKKKFFLRFNKKNVLPFSDLKRKEFEERGKKLKEPLRTQFKNAIDDAIVYINKRALGSMGVEDVWNTDAAFNMSPEVQSEPQQSLEAPPVKRRHLTIAPPVKRRRLTIAPPVKRRRLTIAPPVKRRRLTIAPPVKRRRLTIAPPVKRRRLTIAGYNSRASKQIENRKLKLKERNQGVVEFIISEDMKKYLLEILKKERKSELHQKYQTSQGERNRLRHAGFGPIENEDQQDMITFKMIEWMREITGNTIVDVGYILDVWVPEAVVKALIKVKQYRRGQAWHMFWKGYRMTKAECREIHNQLIESPGYST